MMIQIKDRNLYELAQEHWSHIEKHFKKRTNDVTFDDIDVFCRNIKPGFSFEKMIKASYQELEDIKENLYEKIKRIQNYDNCSRKIKSIYNKFSMSNKSIGDSGYNVIEFVENIDITVCPYCNRNYIDTRGYNNLKKSGCQIDHFYSQSTYPLFALCFYNLIPVCPSCNHTKSIKELYISPYDENKRTDDIIEFDWELMDADYLQNKNDITIVYNCSEEMELQFKELKLDKPYKMHNDVVYEIIKRAKLYDDIKLKELSGDFPQLYFDKEEIVEILFGADVEGKDYLKRPLSKLKYDIVKKLIFKR